MKNRMNHCSSSIVVGLMFLLCGLARPAEGQELPSAVVPADLNVAACKMQLGERVVDATESRLRAAFGFVNEGRGWYETEQLGTNPARTTVTFLIVFNRAVPAGSIFLRAAADEVSILKSEIVDPIDPNNDAQWQRLKPVPSPADARLFTLDAGATVRAIRVRGTGADYNTSLPTIRLYQQRLFNLAPLGRAFAESEYTLISAGGSPPFTFAINTPIMGGWGHWQNTGKNNTGRIPRAPVTDLEPAWYMLTWREPVTISGVWMADNFQQLEFDTYTGPDTLPPRAGTNREWRKIRGRVDQSVGGRLTLFKPLTTRGLRVRILKTSESAVASLYGIHVLTDLKEQVAPEVRTSTGNDAPPVRIDYAFDFPGLVTMAVDDPQGRRVKNLFARRDKPAGPNVAGWDLKDEEGRTVSPGTYRWKAIGHPGLEYRYEMTAYPNVHDNHPDSVPWHTGMSGPGGWLADHTPPRAGATFGDLVFFGAPVSESGVSFIACDLTGKKLWAVPSFAGFTGAWAIAADARGAYAIARADNVFREWNVDVSTEPIWKVDVQNPPKFTEVARLQPTATRKRGIVGQAARDGLLYLSIRAEEDWFTGVASSADVDIENCYPKYPVRRKERVAFEMVPDPRTDFMRLFRLTGTVAGGYSIDQIESTKGRSPRRHVLLAFNRPIAIGSAVLPKVDDPNVTVKLSALKPDAPYPPNPGNPDQWLPFDSNTGAPWDVATAPKDLTTRAVRVTFLRGDDDPLSQMDDAAEYAAETSEGGLNQEKAEDIGIEGVAWQAFIDGIKLLSRRFENVAPSAKVTVSSGSVGADGVWDAKRTAPLSDADPGIYMLAWEDPQLLRGLAIKEIDGRRTQIDVWTGDGAPKLESAEGWETVGTYLQPRRDLHSGFPTYNGKARYLDGYLNFPREISTRGVRLRVCEQWVETGEEGPRPDVQQFSPIDLARCRIFGIAAMKYVGGENAAGSDPLMFHRIEVLDTESGKINHEVGLVRPGAIALDATGRLLAVSGGSVVVVDLAGGKHTPLVSEDLIAPKAMAVDSKGNIYVYDNAPERKHIRVYAPDGKPLRVIGTSGGYVAGAWDPNRFQDVTSLVIDKNDQLWVVDQTYFPKRISRWTTAGQWQQDFLGNTWYGGAGVLDSVDKTRAYYGPLEFELNWETGKTRLKNLTWTGDGRAGDVPIRVDGRLYMTTRFESTTSQQCAYVYLHDGAKLTRVAALGAASGFSLLSTSKAQVELGGIALNDKIFHWSDLNLDGEVQKHEITFMPKDARFSPMVMFNDDLGIQGGQTRFSVKEFLPNGVPIYQTQIIPIPAGDRPMFRLDSGNYYQMGSNSFESIYAPDGTRLSLYPAEGESTHGLARAKPFSPEQVVSQFTFSGHGSAHAGDLGEFMVIHTNLGSWNLWTSDGMLAGWIFKDQRSAGARQWTMSEHQRGMDLANLSVGQEHFSGYFTRTADNKYYAIAGHNHLSIVEVLGMDKFKRLGGAVEITPELIARTQEWESTQSKETLFDRAPVLDCYKAKTPKTIDGNVGDWDVAAADLGEKEHGKIKTGVSFRAAWDDQYLYVAFESQNMGPLKNSGQQWDRLFKTGAAVDIQISNDATADTNRRAPVAGDKRVLLTFVGGDPKAVLYDAVVPGTAKEQTWQAISPVAQVSFDQVLQAEGVRMAASANFDQPSQNVYVVEAAIPLSILGRKPAANLRLKFDWGVLVTDPSGNAVVRRVYWANQATGIVADVPSEARLQPDLWGHILFHEGGARDFAEATEILGENGMNRIDEDDDMKNILKEFEGDLEEDLKE